MSDETSRTNLRELLSGVFFYPLCGDGKYVLLVGTVFFWLASIVITIPLLGIAVGLVAAFYLGAFFLDVVRSSAAGEKKLPGWPAIYDVDTDLVIPCLRALVCVVISGLPVWGVLIAEISTSWEASIWMWVGTGLLSGFYLPMSFLVVILTDNILTMSPHIVLPSIARMSGHYLFVCFFLAVIIFLAVMVVNILQSITVITSFPITVIVSLLEVFLLLYVGSVAMRVLGLLYDANRHKLGWFDIED